MKKILIIAMVFISLDVFAGSITLIERDYPQLNGVQVFVFDPMYENNVGLFFDEVKEKGGDTVFFRVFQNETDRYHFLKTNKCTTGVYFNTTEACVIEDLLGNLIEEAHKRGIKLYAWMATRTLSFLKTPDMMEKTFTSSGVSDGYGASIFSSKAKGKLITLFEDLASYDIDGILFQDDFILRYSEGASLSAKHAYYADAGVILTYNDLFDCNEITNNTRVRKGCNDVYLPWAEWKTKKMAEFFAEIRLAVLLRNPSVKFAANIYYETPVDKTKGVSWYSQSIEKLLDAGFDYLAVMSYHDQIKRELNLNNAEAKEYVNKMLNGLIIHVEDKERILMKLQRISWTDKSSLDTKELEDICSLIDSYGEISKAIVPVNNKTEIFDSCF